VAKFVRAWESADLGALVALLTGDVFMSMPPMPFEYQGRDVVARFCASLLRSRRSDLVPTRANGQPAFGAYQRAPGGIRHGTGPYVLALSGDRICALTRFDNSGLPWFGLPRSLPSREPELQAAYYRQNAALTEAGPHARVSGHTAIHNASTSPRVSAVTGVPSRPRAIEPADMQVKQIRTRKPSP
jgi:hypothetical protein